MREWSGTVLLYGVLREAGVGAWLLLFIFSHEQPTT